MNWTRYGTHRATHDSSRDVRGQSVRCCFFARKVIHTALETPCSRLRYASEAIGIQHRGETVTLADGQAHQTRRWKTPAAPRKDPRTIEKMEDGNSEQRKFPGKEDAVGHPVERTQVSNHASGALNKNAKL
jgi:hypothetical protein